MDDDTNIFTVVKTTQVKSLAGAIAHRARKGRFPVLTALGQQAVSQAVKAIAIANNFVRHDGMCLLSLAERKVDPERRNLRDLFMITIRDMGELDIIKGISEHACTAIRCAKDSDPEALAAYFLPKTREDARVQIQSIGPRAVFKAVDSICCARQTLLEESYDLGFVPEVEDVEFDDNVVRTGVNFCLFVADQFF
jgi:stage V sporulation protein SpoVS